MGTGKEAREARNGLAIPVVVAGIVKEGRIVLLKRTCQPYRGLWSLPGGKIRHSESVVEAVRREVREETSIELCSVEYMGVISEKVFKGSHLVNSHLIHVFCCEAQGEGLVCSDEGETKWFSPREVLARTAEMIPTDLMIVKKMLLSNSGGSYSCSVELSRDGRYGITEFARTA